MLAAVTEHGFYFADLLTICLSSAVIHRHEMVCTDAHGLIQREMLFE